MLATQDLHTESAGSSKKEGDKETDQSKEQDGHNKSNLFAMTCMPPKDAVLARVLGIHHSTTRIDALAEQSSTDADTSLLVANFSEFCVLLHHLFFPDFS